MISMHTMAPSKPAVKAMYLYWFFIGVPLYRQSYKIFLHSQKKVVYCIVNNQNQIVMTKKSLTKKQKGGSLKKAPLSAGVGTKASQRNLLRSPAERDVYPIGGRPKEKTVTTSLKSKKK